MQRPQSLWQIERDAIKNPKIPWGETGAHITEINGRGGCAVDKPYEIKNFENKKMKPFTIIRNGAAVFALFSIFTACATTAWNQEQADNRVNIGAAYLGSERYNDALREFFDAEKLAPRDPKVHYYLGVAYHRKGLKDNAITEFTKALSLRSDYSEAHNNLGIIYLEMGLWDKAIESFKNALANVLYETPDKALFNMGTAYRGKGNYEKAIAFYQDAKNTKPNTVPPPVVDLYMGMTYYAQGNCENAVQYFKAALNAAPSLVESRYWLGQCYIKMHDPDKARAEFTAIIAVTEPDSGLGREARKAFNSLR
jgi:tetratricopeptide (TPR) repeat protein